MMETYWAQCVQPSMQHGKILSFCLAGELDDKMKWLKNFDRLLEIQRSIVWPSVLELDPKQYFPEFLKVLTDC